MVTGRKTAAALQAKALFFGKAVLPLDQMQSARTHFELFPPATEIGILLARESGSGLKRLIEVVDQVAHIFGADRQTHQLGRDAGLDLLGFAQLRVSGGSGMDHQRLRVSHICQQAEQRKRVDQLAAGFVAALDAKRDQGSAAIRKILFCARVVLAGGQARIVDPRDSGMRLQILRQRQGVLRMSLHAQMQGLGSLQEQKRVERREAGSGVAQALHPRLDDERQRPESFGIGNAVVRGIGIDEIRKASRSLPVELAAIDDDAADGGPMAADELGGRVDDDIRTPLDRPAESGRGAGIVDDQRQPVLMGDAGKGFDIDHVELGIAEGLGVNGLGLRADRLPNAVEIVGIDEAHR